MGIRKGLDIRPAERHTPDDAGKPLLESGPRRLVRRGIQCKPVENRPEIVL